MVDIWTTWHPWYLAGFLHCALRCHTLHMHNLKIYGILHESLVRINCYETSLVETVKRKLTKQGKKSNSSIKSDMWQQAKKSDYLNGSSIKLTRHLIFVVVAKFEHLLTHDFGMFILGLVMITFSTTDKKINIHWLYSPKY